jgi:hypothetical protein
MRDSSSHCMFKQPWASLSLSSFARLIPALLHRDSCLFPLVYILLFVSEAYAERNLGDILLLPLPPCACRELRNVPKSRPRPCSCSEALALRKRGDTKSCFQLLQKIIKKNPKHVDSMAGAKLVHPPKLVSIVGGSSDRIGGDGGADHCRSNTAWGGKQSALTWVPLKAVERPSGVKKL